MSKKHRSLTQKQFTKTVDEFSRDAVRDTPEVAEARAVFARPQPGEDALDVACGPGTLVLRLAPHLRFARGVDFTHAMLLRAKEFQRQRGIINACFDQGEGEHLPYPDGAFHLVTCQFAFHHIMKPEAVLLEMVRVVRPEGRLLVVDTLGPESDEKWELHNRIEQLRDPSHVASIRLTSFLKLFEDAGLEITRQSLKSHQRSFTNWMERAGVKKSDPRYQEVRQRIEDAIPGDKAGFLAQPQGNDLILVHHEGMFLLERHRE
ncbi:MAG: class I SAM-dependent methyltransferase [Terriglobia bacterium]